MVAAGEAAGLGEPGQGGVGRHPAVGEQLVQLALAVQGPGHGVVLAGTNLGTEPAA
ncbi:hypothetical protein [Synechococcus sp. BSA11S]|uniref:hypothetical protein n=1 Tax=Synechococcus sp. BSA11S TaxID=2599077 RepID=UPI0016263484|nr:hypothetical protein [Synechococcus sp. BSA11S]